MFGITMKNVSDKDIDCFHTKRRTTFLGGFSEHFSHLTANKMLVLYTSFFSGFIQEQFIMWCSLQRF